MEKVNYCLREGEPFDIGRSIGEKLCKNELKMTSFFDNLEMAIDSDSLTKTMDLFTKYCPHVLEEINGFSNVLEIESRKNFYLSYSFISPSCSQLAIKNSTNYPDSSVLVRNYDFDLSTEDFVIVNYKSKDNYHFIGTSMLTFGVDSGVNEHGLAVSMSACGPPVGIFQKAKVSGLRFWVVIRLLLETCKTVGQAKELLSELPLGDNVSYVCIDSTDNMLLYQTVNGVRDYSIVENSSENYSIHVTNHPTFPKTVCEFPYAAQNSLIRYHLLENYLKVSGRKSLSDLKKIFTTLFPRGLYCNYYDEFFGTTKTVVLYPKERKLEICWCGLEKNGWKTYELNDSKEEETYVATYEKGIAPEDMFNMIRLKE
ncbi:C45 family autoproteolytic acyltransferase/hydrolase [Vagococcus elongatus]|uniref:Peptidase C45 hydrolase domain-containing protein n=1 Tax=Vagococcus elongatus TaxID=180344 RepID=A0A430ASH2_9ENTE|nr:C45 family peptidase [Vagococcus elongatus]RSU11012.1 hypothetical protein CBF29_08605 [Vagococcus elongatus]